jgi:hypothetical protein
MGVTARSPIASWAYRLCVVVPIAIVGCSTRAPETGTSFRDSAGVTIVESRVPSWRFGGHWTLGAEPMLEIGTSEGATEYEFSRIEGGIRLDDGRCVIADGGSQELRFYGEAGEFLHATGGAGEAPGEYRAVTALGRGPGDSLWVYDYGLRRFTILTADGQPVRVLSLGGIHSAPNAVGRLADGSFVVKESWGSTSSQETRLGLARAPIAVVRFSPDGSELDTVVTLPGREVFITSERGRGVMSTPLFAHSASAALRGADVVVGDQSTFEIAVYSSTGVLTRVFRIPDRDLRITDRDVDLAIESIVVREPADRRPQSRARLAAMETPSTRPAYGRLLVDRVGNVWAGAYARYPDIPRSWTVFAATGELLGDVRMPERFDVLEIGDDWVLGVWRDALDVEHVRLYRLLKNASGP